MRNQIKQLILLQVFSAIIFIFLLIYNIIQLFEPIEHKITEKIFSFYNILFFVILLLSLFNLLCGVTVNIIKKAIKKYAKNIIFKFFKKILNKA